MVEQTAINKSSKNVIPASEGNECSGFGEATVFEGELVAILKH